MSEATSPVDEINAQTDTLSPAQKLPVLEHLASVLREEVLDRKLKRSLWRLCEDLGPVPSDKDIAEIRREMWSDFPRKEF
ncbi:MAG: hypothetical protein OHK0046_03140 [Anaerolineae bacterium]